ncbi:hypothetical protein ACI7YT_12655 [Microbacterium sp. M]|uniref:hypothetical protein n=1 Tax=Microbacterium sp. M TaxID=3377125 RepID=UPI003867A78F
MHSVTSKGQALALLGLQHAAAIEQAERLRHVSPDGHRVALQATRYISRAIDLLRADEWAADDYSDAQVF